jgi:serine/threonine protein kinase
MLEPLDPEDPQTVGGFQLIGRLGEGGQGVVYLGLTPDGDRAAVKVIKGGLDPVVRARLTRELDAIRSVATFCTARVLAAEIAERQPYVVSEFIDGPSLQQRVAESGPLRGGELERLAVGTATALAAIHGAGIVHRDLKPANVLLGPDGPRVVDFGIARQGESDTMTAGPVGTPAYLAPEQIAGQPATPASDIFAWAATIVYAATGRAAFGADSVAAVMHRIMTATPDVNGVPAPLRATVERCLSKDPAHRPTSRDLLLGLVGSPPEAAPEASGSSISMGAVTTGPAGYDLGRLPTAPGGRRRGRTRLLLGLGVAAVALAVSGVLLWPRVSPLLSTSTATATSTATSTAAPSPVEPTTHEPSETGPSESKPSETKTGETKSPGGMRIPAAFAGTWEGHTVPTPAGITGEYDIRIELVAGRPSGTWAEPANSCEGTLRLTGATASALTFALENVGVCVPGTVTLRKSGDQLAYQWNDAAGLLTYNGDLSKKG